MLRVFLPLASPLNFSQSEFISLLFSGIFGPSTLSLTMAFPISQLVRSPFVPVTVSFIQELSFPHLSPPSRARAQAVFVQLNWPPLLLKYVLCWASPLGQSLLHRPRVSQTKEKRPFSSTDICRGRRRRWCLGTKPPPTGRTAPCDGAGREPPRS